MEALFLHQQLGLSSMDYGSSRANICRKHALSLQCTIEIFDFKLSQILYEPVEVD